MSKPLIGILGYPYYDSDKDECVVVYSGYKNAVITSGGIPFMIAPYQSIDYEGTRLRNIPSMTEEEKRFYRENVDLCDGIIVQGGYRMYDWHQYIVEYAIEKKIPILGSCAGMQLLAKISNGAHIAEKIDNHKVTSRKFVHDVEIKEGTILRRIFKKKTIPVNSFHSYGIPHIGGNFITSAVAPDGTIEGIEMNEGWVVGVQWHPENMIDSDENAKLLFKAFTTESEKYKELK